MRSWWIWLSLASALMPIRIMQAANFCDIAAPADEGWRGPTGRNPVMEKKRATAEEIQAELRRRIKQCDGACCQSGIPAPRPVTPKASGAPNWTIDGLPELAPGCFTTIVRIVDQARDEFELAA